MLARVGSLSFIAKFCSTIGAASGRVFARRGAATISKGKSGNGAAAEPENFLGRQTVLVGADDLYEATFAIVDGDHKSFLASLAGKTMLICECVFDKLSFVH